MMALVTNIVGCLPVLVLLFNVSSLVTSRYLVRMEREIGYNITTNTNDSAANTTEAKTVGSTTEEPMKTSSALQTTETMTSKSDSHSVSSTDHQTTQQTTENQTSVIGNHSAGTENNTVYQPTGSTITSYTQRPTQNDSIGHTSQAGSAASTLPASTKLTDITRRHTSAHHSTVTHTTKKQTSTTEKPHPCSTSSPQRDGLVSRCLIAIASMAALTTIFIISTICLATKLSGYRYRHKASLLQETEMVCISALLNDSDHPVPKPRHPKSNGALIPSTEDGDPDGDNLTLNSFLPDNEGPL